MRGKLPTFAYRAFHRRIIPAHAGQTWTTCGRVCGVPDHPRACGANAAIFCTVDGICGSSPRMRGKRCHILHGGWYMRIIPAHAGQTGTIDGERRHSSDHPRACGANATSVMPRSMMAGSSPRMRGKPGAVAGLVVPQRIIPAHAGQTPGSRPKVAWRPDHPRACGANITRLYLAPYAYGSSPRMRGKPADDSGHTIEIRIIPAHAGQTRPPTWPTV